jgi:hypothetical protein
VSEDPGQQGSAIDRIRENPALRSRDDSGLWAIAIGVVLWIIAIIVFAFFGDRISGIDATRALQISIAGAVLGIPGLIIVGMRHRRIKSAQDPKGHTPTHQ